MGKYKLKPSRRLANIRTNKKVVAFSGVLLIGGVFIVTIFSSSNNPQPIEELPLIPQEKTSIVESLELNPLEKKAITELIDFTSWLDENNAQGYIGEVGWSNSQHSYEEWNELAEKWYLVADEKDLWTSAWATGSWWGAYPLAIYSSAPEQRVLSQAEEQASVIEKFNSDTMGINLAGLEFGTGPAFSNQNPGTVNQAYFVEPKESFSYLKSRGITSIRLPFRWERLQPTVNGPLSESYLAEIRQMLDAAAKNDIQVILNIHNFGKYITPNGSLQVGSRELPAGALADVWLKLSDEFKDHPATAAYGLMNEPSQFNAVNDRAAALSWEQTSQEVLQAIRDSGDNTLVMIAGYEWSKVSQWRKNHPQGWINDPASNFRYEAHHYWDIDGSGTYDRTYQAELSAL